MKFEIFELERQQSLWEHSVEINLSESGIHPLRLNELVGDDFQKLGEMRLGYPQTNGAFKLRELITELYPGSDESQVTVTNGAAEANYLSCLQLVEPGDEVVVMMPNYLQAYGLTRSLGCQVKAWSLVEKYGDGSESGWRPDLEALETLVNEKTKLITICHPNNPTGSLVGEDDIRAICKIAGRHGCWILADEVYRGAELSGEESATFWGWYDRLLATGGMSKAYALPGLRIGWVVSDSETAHRLWAYKDYTTITTGALSQELAAIALEPRRRHEIQERTRKILREQLPILTEWVDAHADQFGLRMQPPEAGAFGLVRYDLEMDSIPLTEQLRQDHGVLLVAGAYFEQERSLRIGFGGEPDLLREGLARTAKFMSQLTADG